MKSKALKKSIRLFSILTNSIKQTLGQFLSLLLSLYVIHYYSKAVWGDFAATFLYISISLLVLSWGSKDFLIREFSKMPGKMMRHFYLLFNTRLLLVLFSVLITLFVFPKSQSLYIALWLIGGYVAQSLEVFWIYKRDYLQSIAIEILSFLILLGFVYNQTTLTADNLITYYSYYQIIRALFFVLLYFGNLKNIHFSIDKSYLWISFPFFMLSFVGFLQSRIDFLIITFFETHENVAIYQVINTYFILIHALGTFMILPYMKNFYRLKTQSMETIQRKISMIAPFLVLCCLMVFYLLIRFVYQFNLDIYYYFIGIFITFPPYLYAVRIIQLFKENKQNTVLFVGIKAIIINSLVSFLLLHFRFGLKGALLGSAVAQLFTAYQYLKMVRFEK